MAYELIEDLSKQNVVYVEVRCNPLAGLPALSGDTYTLGVLEGLERGEREFGVKARSIFAFKREEPGELAFKGIVEDHMIIM